MLRTIPAEIRKGKISFLEKIRIPEGSRLLITVMSNNEGDFWPKTAEALLKKIWNNTEDDVYEKLLA
jgi:hypothetical protein